MKKHIIICVIFFISLFISNRVNAEEQVKITINETIELENGSLLVPVVIENNFGLMGFKISISYGDGVEIHSISRGDISAKGQFLSNYRSKKSENYFEVLWNNTSAISDDGSLFIIGMTVSNKVKDDILLHIEYSMKDTFDESYKEVEIICDDVVITNKVSEIDDKKADDEIVKDNNSDRNENNQELDGESYQKKSEVESDSKKNTVIVKRRKESNNDENALKNAKSDIDIRKYINDNSDNIDKVIEKILKKENKEELSKVDKKIFAKDFLEEALVDTDITEEKAEDIYEDVSNIYNKKSSEKNVNITKMKEEQIIKKPKNNNGILISIVFLVIFLITIICIFVKKKKN